MRLFVFLLLFTHLGVVSQNVTIKGSSVSPIKPVRIIVKEDFVSGLEKVLATSSTDFKGSFQISVEINKIELAEIAIGLNRVPIILKPNADYEVAITVTSENQNSYFDPQPMVIEMKKTTDSGLQKHYETINFVYNTFVIKYFNQIQRFGQARYLDSLQLALSNALPKTIDPFLQNYQFYKVSSLAPAIKKMTPQQIYAAFFKSRIIQYENPEYMAMIDQYFGDYFTSGKKQIPFDDFVEAVNQGFVALKKMVLSDPLMTESDQFRELVLLFHLNANYYNPAFYSGSISRVLQQIVTQSAYNQHKIIAENILKKRAYLTPGTPSPLLKLFDSNGIVAHNMPLKSLVVALFVKNDCEVCKKEILDFSGITEKFGTDINVLIVTTQDAYKETENFLTSNKLTWQLFHTGDDMLVYERYNIKVFPEYVLLFPDGRIAMTPAPPVSQNLEYHISRLIKQLKRE
ncbi:MAG: thiol-disulfide isomerase [Bacteroidetes bacterium]|nr:MAG: thiol-disulfide isomerase [Bacteroidota bacterium]